MALYYAYIVMSTGDTERRNSMMCKLCANDKSRKKNTSRFLHVRTKLRDVAHCPHDGTESEFPGGLDHRLFSSKLLRLSALEISILLGKD